MARTIITVQDAPRSGLTPTFTALAAGAGNGAQIPYDAEKRTGYRFRNTGASAATVTFLFNTTNAKIDGQSPANPTGTIPATTGDVIFKPLNEYYKQADGNVYIECSAAVEIAAIKFGSS